MRHFSYLQTYYILGYISEIPTNMKTISKYHLNAATAMVKFKLFGKVFFFFTDSLPVKKYHFFVVFEAVVVQGRQKNTYGPGRVLKTNRSNLSSSSAHGCVRV